MILGSIDVILSRHALPPQLQTYKHTLRAADRASGRLAWEGAIAAGVMLAYAIAIIGLFRFWPFARPLFAVLIVISFISTLWFGPRIQTRSVASFDDAITVLEGVVLALLYWSPIRERFIRITVV
jgi:hypothetical protein